MAGPANYGDLRGEFTSAFRIPQLATRTDDPPLFRRCNRFIRCNLLRYLLQMLFEVQEEIMVAR